MYQDRASFPRDYRVRSWLSIGLFVVNVGERNFGKLSNFSKNRIDIVLQRSHFHPQWDIQWTNFFQVRFLRSDWCTCIRGPGITSKFRHLVNSRNILHDRSEKVWHLANVSGSLWWSLFRIIESWLVINVKKKRLQLSVSVFDTHARTHEYRGCFLRCCDIRSISRETCDLASKRVRNRIEKKHQLDRSLRGSKGIWRWIGWEGRTLRRSHRKLLPLWHRMSPTSPTSRKTPR